MRKKFIRFLWGALLTIITGGTLLFFAIWFGVIGYMPDIEELQNPINRSASQVYSADGKLIGTYNFNRENRIIVSYDSLTTDLVHALVATEDERFYEHSGIDFIAIGRAIVKRGFMGQESAGGGSTITQQLAKQLYSETAHNKFERVFQKMIESVIAIKLERNYTKEEIIAMYLNYFDFLHNAVGIKIAANTYFSKEPRKLTLAESATLIGLCKNPSMFNPVRYPERALERRNVVLSQMEKAGYISYETYEKTCAEPINLHFHRADHKEGLAPYFRDFLRQYMMAQRPDRDNYPQWNYRQYVIDSISWVSDPLYGWCNKNFKRNGQPYNLYTDGLRIITTVDSRMQRYAEESVYEHVVRHLQPIFTAEARRKPNYPFSHSASATQIKSSMNRAIRNSERYRTLKDAGLSDEEIRQSFNTPTEMTIFTYRGEKDTVMTPIDSIKYYKTFLRSGFVCMDPKTGQVKAYVGGLNFDHFMYDMATLGRRQIGSTAKPYLYSLAMENGFTPCDEILNKQITYGGWSPRNGSHARYGQMVSLKWGLSQSNNWCAANLMAKLGPPQLVALLREYGINNPDIEPHMAICLGPYEVTVAEMVSAYTTFANNGIRTAPLFVTKIEDNEGNVICEFQPRMNEVISAESAHRMIDMLKAVITSGTGSRLKGLVNISGDVCGKTGTTNNNSDGWFMGFTPELVAGCWVGAEDRDVHFESTGMGQGASMALPVWAYFMKRVFADRTLPYHSDAKFDIPKDWDPCGNSSLSSDFGIEDVYE